MIDLEEGERLDRSLQENVLTLLVFDAKYASLVSNIVPINSFGSRVYRDIAFRAIQYLEEYKAPIGEHIADELEDILSGSDDKKAKMYEIVLDNLFLSYKGINAEYVVSKLRSFVRQQYLKGGIVEATKYVADGAIDEAEKALEKALQKRIEVFDEGTFLKNHKKSLKFLDTTSELLLTGIKEFDKRRICPARKQLFMFIAPPKRGKSWWLVHLGKMAIQQRFKTLHISLEMSEEEVSKRYVQSLYSVTSREQDNVQYKTFKQRRRSQRGLMFEDVLLDNRRHLQMEDSRLHFSRKLSKLRTPLIVKQFPTSTLTISGLRSYLLSLERLHHFTPDLLLIDYVDLMRVDSRRVREEVGAATKELRGIGVEYNCAVVTATQGNRLSAQARVVSEHHVAEDWSKIATSDIVVTYSRTDAERLDGLARLTVTNARSEVDKFTVLVSQAYDIGQFCMDSIYIPDQYLETLE